jgi:hypothetical protein
MLRFVRVIDLCVRRRSSLEVQARKSIAMPDPSTTMSWVR